jgi:uncharacterized protein
MQSLLQYSAVCGCGLDTVPIPGLAPDTSIEERESLIAAVASTIFDTAALAFRLGKPLSVRLLPVAGKRAGEVAAFGSPYMVGDTVVLDPS